MLSLACSCSRLDPAGWVLGEIPERGKKIVRFGFGVVAASRFGFLVPTKCAALWLGLLSSSVVLCVPELPSSSLFAVRSFCPMFPLTFCSASPCWLGSLGGNTCCKKWGALDVMCFWRVLASPKILPSDHIAAVKVAFLTCCDMTGNGRFR